MEDKDESAAAAFRLAEYCRKGLLPDQGGTPDLQKVAVYYKSKTVMLTLSLTLWH